jgi:putative PEP-CTERM system TPR-repeat lipoprotein
LHKTAGVLYLNNGRFNQALVHFRKGTEIDASDATLWLNLGRAQQALGQEGSARESLAQALKIKPDWLPAEGALAFIDLQSGQRAAALERIARLQKRYPRDTAVLMLAGDVHGTLRDYAEAARAFEAAAQIQPSGPLAVKIYEARRAGQQPKPLEPLERWVEKNPDDLLSRSVLADAYTLTGERQRAVEQYERIVGVQPRHVPSLNNLAWLYFELKDGRAVEFARKAHTLAPAVSSVSDTLGWILVESGQIEEALPILRSAAAVAGANPEIRYHYAVALARSGANDPAHAELDRVLKEHASFHSREAAQRLQERLKSGGSAGT